MGVIRKPYKDLIHDGASSAGSETHSAPGTDTESVGDSGTVTPQPGLPVRTSVCPLQVRRGLGAHAMKMKQGRRTKQR